jgi:hypothetical protein
MILLSVFVLAGCGSPECEAQLASSQRTVASVSWKTRKPGPSHVEYGVDGAFDRSTPVADDGEKEHSAMLLGLPPLADVAYRAVTESGGREWTCEGTFQTGNLPSGLPDLEVTAWDETLADPDTPYVFGTAIGDPGALYVVERATGEWLWALPTAADVSRVDVAFSPGGNDLMWNELDTNRRIDVGTVERVRWDGELVESTRTELAHHMFTVLPDGTITWVALDVRPWVDPADGRTYDVVGDQLLEMSPDGEQRLVFTVWDWIEPVRNEAWDTHFYTQGEDWTHANGLNYDPERGTYLLSLGNARMVLEVDRETGEPVRTFGGPDGYAFAEGSYPFFKQHDPQWTEEGHLLVSLTDQDTNASGAVEYAVDDEARTLTTVWQHGLRGSQNAFALGQAIRLGNGNTIVSWGGAGIVKEVTPDGDVAWQMNLSTGAYYGQMIPFGDFYSP